MPAMEQPVSIPIGPIAVSGDLAVPDNARGIVIFAHGTGSSRHSPRNRFVAQVLQQSGLATLLMDLLTPQEESFDSATGELRFNVQLLAARLVAATEWLAGCSATRSSSRATLAPAQAPQPRWWRPPGCRAASEPSFPAAGGPIWRGPHCNKSAHPRF